MNVRVLRWVIVGLLVVGGLAFVAVGANSPADPTLRAADGPVSLKRTPFGDFKEIGFRIEGGSAQATAARCALLAETAAQQARGLMERQDLAGYDGMLFRFEEAQPVGFWMRNTRIPLDMIFIRADGTIARIAANTVPHSEESVTSGEPVAAVLEIAGGRAAELGIAPGDRVSW